MTIKAVMLLPVQDNDGSDLWRKIDAVEEALFTAFDGWTRDGSVVGAFRMTSGVQKIDVSIRYFVFLDETRLPDVERILLEFKTGTLQEAIYLEVQRAIEFRLI